MSYIVFDLEFNQSFNFGSRKQVQTKPSCPFEIIHLGAVKLDENFRSVESFDSLVKPRLYTRLHPYVKKMTKITKADLQSSKPFREVYSDFVEFIGDNAILCVWGIADIRELYKNIMYHKLDTSPIPDRYIDVQHHTNKYLKQPANTSIGLGNAVKLLNISDELNFHNAINDAYYTAEVFKIIHAEHINPEIYKFDASSSPKKLIKPAVK